MTHNTKGATLPRRDHFDAGLEWLKSNQQPGQRFTEAEMARACGVSHQAMNQRIRKILTKLQAKFWNEIREGKQL